MLTMNTTQKTFVIFGHLVKNTPQIKKNHENGLIIKRKQ